MKRKNAKQRRGSSLTLGARVTIAAAVLLVAVLLSSCGSTWDWLWTRDTGRPVDTNDMVLNGDGTAESEAIFEGAVEYTGEAHSGTDIYYVGKGVNRRHIIVIDAGHQLKGSSAKEPNGPDSTTMKDEVTWGATGVYTNTLEYDLNLKVALLLRDELIRRRYSVVMIRETNNVDISNMRRAQIANKYSAAAYVRIHANSWTDESMNGAMTICHSASNPYPNCAATYEDSRLLSELVLEEFCKQTGIKQLNVREMDNMTGTNWSEVPTTIVEMGFLSNKSDDRLMATDYFRQEAAMGIADGLDAYFVRLAEIEAEESRQLAESIAEASREEASRNEAPEEGLTDSENGSETAPPMFSPAPTVTEVPEDETDDAFDVAYNR